LWRRKVAAPSPILRFSAACKAQHDASAKLQEKIQQERSAIKDAQASKDAKAFIEKLDLTS
jgi:formate-dependent nitrite reductase cytochrome c552 subunit